MDNLRFSDNKKGQPLYIKLYEHYRELISTKRLEPGSHMPSIRRCAAELELSRTTVETAYMQLAAEGYIVSKPKSGYTVCDIGAYSKRVVASDSTVTPHREAEIKFDFVSTAADEESFNLKLWSRYVKGALRQQERLLSYGEPQGEPDLRQAVCDFAASHRSVVCTPQQVVIGAGTQSLLHILCALIKKPRAAAFVGPFFEKGSAVLSDHGIGSVSYPQFPENPEVLTKNGEGLIYISPSHMSQGGDVLPVSKRRKLLELAEEKGCLILEDDYDSEFRYYSRPVPSLQGIDTGESVVYLGTFSKLLLPSIRISFMVLPERLLPAYASVRERYNQTASTTEQLALCRYIRDGRLSAQIKKQRKLYTTKSDLLCEEIHRAFGNSATAATGGAGYLVRLKINSEKTASELTGLAREAGISVTPLRDTREEKPTLLLNCTGVPTEDFAEAMGLLKAALT